MDLLRGTGPGFGPGAGRGVEHGCVASLRLDLRIGHVRGFRLRFSPLPRPAGDAGGAVVAVAAAGNFGAAALGHGSPFRVRATIRAAWLAAAAGAAIMVIMMVFRNPIVHLLFERGAFGRDSSDAVASVLLGYMPVMIGRSLSEFLSRALFGMGRFKVPFSAAVVALIVNSAICAVLPNRWPLLIGVGAATGFLAGAIWLVVYVRRVAKEE